MERKLRADAEAAALAAIDAVLPDKAVDAIQPTAADPFYDLADWTIHWAESTPS